MIFNVFTKEGPCFCYESDEPTTRLPTILLEDNHADVTLTSTPKSSEWSLSFKFYHNSVRIPLLLYTCHNPCPSLPHY